MKKLIYLFGILLSGFLFSQSADQQKILTDSELFMSFFQQKNYDKILEMSHPALLEKYDKEMLVNIFKTIFEGNEDFKIKLHPIDKKLYRVSDIFQSAEGGKYAFVSYPISMEMIFLKQKPNQETKEMMVKMLSVQGMEAQFLNDTTVAIKKLALTVALNDKSTKHVWKYLNHDEGNTLYTSIVPVEIIKRAKSYYSDLLLKEKENAN